MNPYIRDIEELDAARQVVKAVKRYVDGPSMSLWGDVVSFLKLYDLTVATAPKDEE